MAQQALLHHEWLAVERLAMNKYLLITVLLLPGCVMLSSADIVHQKNGLSTIGYHTGSDGKDLYDDIFKSKATEICAGEQYDVLERSFSPTTLSNFKVLSSYTFYWVIKCRK